MTTVRPSFFNKKVRPALGLQQKEDYLLRPLIEAIRNLPDYNEDISRKMHYDGSYIKPIKLQSDLLKEEIINLTPEKLEELKEKINDIANDTELLFFFSKDEFAYDGIRRNDNNGSLRERIKKKEPNKEWDLKTSNFYYYRNEDGNDVEIPSIYDKIMKIDENYANSINKWRSEQNKKNNALTSKLNNALRKDSYHRFWQKDLDCRGNILIMESIINDETDKKEVLNYYVEKLNKECTNNELKKIAENIIKQLCSENGLTYGTEVKKLIINISDRQTNGELEGSNNFAGGKRKSSCKVKRRKTSRRVKRRNTKRRYRK